MSSEILAPIRVDFLPKDGGGTFFGYVGTHVPKCTALSPDRPYHDTLRFENFRSHGDIEDK